MNQNYSARDLEEQRKNRAVIILSSLQIFSIPKKGIGSNAPRSYIPSTSEVTQLLDNQFAVLQHLEGQVEFYKVSLHKK